MQAYSKVRFIGYTLPTTASLLIPIGDVNGKGSDGGFYSGDADTTTDINARIDILMTGIEQAYAEVPIDSDTINVFVLPEFYFHGIYGPYFFTDNDPLLYLQDQLKEKLQIPKYSNWIFICGSIITLETNKSIGALLSEFSAINSNIKNLSDTYISQMLAGQFDIAAKTADTIKNIVVASHNEPNALPVKNRSVIINNINYTNTGKNWGDLSTEKEYISNEDVVLYGSNGSETVTEQMSKYPEIDFLNGLDIKQSKNDQLAIFDVQYQPSQPTLAGITNLGIEICLDHSNNRLRSRMTQNDANLGAGFGAVHLQIIPSCGMQIHADAVVADTNGFVFNCDGEYAITDQNGVDGIFINNIGPNSPIPYSSPTYPNGQYQYQSHTQLARVANQAIGDTPGTNNASYQTLDPANTKVVSVNQGSNFGNYFAGGPGEIHIYGINQAYELYP